MLIVGNVFSFDFLFYKSSSRCSFNADIETINLLDAERAAECILYSVYS